MSGRSPDAKKTIRTLKACMHKSRGQTPQEKNSNLQISMKKPEDSANEKQGNPQEPRFRDNRCKTLAGATRRGLEKKKTKIVQKLSKKRDRQQVLKRRRAGGHV